jgi:hypothetical protein
VSNNQPSIEGIEEDGMSGKFATNEELQRMHSDVLLGIINDFLCWGGAPQTEQARLAVNEVIRRFEERERNVRYDEKILAVF